MKKDAKKIQGIKASDGDADSYCADGQYTEYEMAEGSTEMSSKKVYRVLDKSGSPITTVIAERGEILSQVEKALKNRPGGRHSAWQAWQAGGQMILDDENNTFFSVGTNPQSVNYFANQYRKAAANEDMEQAMGIFHHVEDKLGHYASVEFVTQVSDIEF